MVWGDSCGGLWGLFGWWSHGGCVLCAARSSCCRVQLLVTAGCGARLSCLFLPLQRVPTVLFVVAGMQLHVVSRWPFLDCSPTTPECCSWPRRAFIMLRLARTKRAAHRKKRCKNAQVIWRAARRRRSLPLGLPSCWLSCLCALSLSLSL